MVLRWKVHPGAPGARRERHREFYFSECYFEKAIEEGTGFLDGDKEEPNLQWSGNFVTEIFMRYSSDPIVPYVCKLGVKLADGS